MLVMYVGHEADKAAIWHWGPDDVQRYTKPDVLATNPHEVVMAMGALLLMHRTHWIAEGWTHVWVEDAFRSRVIWDTDLADLPVNDQALFPWVIGKVKDYAAQYQ